MRRRSPVGANLQETRSARGTSALAKKKSKGAITHLEHASHPHEQSLEHIASRILVCSPRTGLRRVAADDMRQWICWQPGVLFRSGCLDLLTGEPEVYLGGLTLRQHLFVFIPESVYEHRRMALFHQLARELPQMQERPVPGTDGKRVEQQDTEACSVLSPGHPVWEAEARARQVQYWLRLLSHRKEVQTPGWRW